MAYTLVDLLEKLRAIEECAAKMYEEIANNCSKKNKKISIAAKVLLAEEMRHVGYYSEMIKDSKGHEDIEIDFDIYDKAYSLMNEFRNRIYTPQVSSVAELITFASEFEKSNIALLLDIRGRMVRDSSDSTNFNYLAITEIILEEQKHSDALSSFIK
jgi:rubrerythrin